VWFTSVTGQENLVVTAVGEDTTDINRIAQQLSAAGVTIEREGTVLDETFQPYNGFAPEDDRASSAVTDFQTVVGGGEVVEFTVSETADIAGLTNQEGLLPDKILVVGIERDGTHVTPNGDTQIKPGDLVSVFSPETLPEQLVNAFNSEPRPADGKV